VAKVPYNPNLEDQTYMTLPTGWITALRCGREFVVKGGKPEDLQKAMRVACDSNEEARHFMMGVEGELADLHEMTR
jgi:hypothetical protein